MTNWGFNPKDMDKSIRPQDDFYRYANGGWLKRNPIPETEARWGGFLVLRFETEQQLNKILTDLLKKKYPKDSFEGLVSNLYRSAIDLKRREGLKDKPFEGLKKKIRLISSKKELLQLIAALHRLGLSAIWNTAIGQDSKDSSKYITYLVQDGLGMPDRDYYLKNTPEEKRVREAYIEHIGKLLSLAKFNPKESKERARVIMIIEKKLAEVSMIKEDTRDVEKTYHKRNLPKWAKEVPQIDWKKYFNDIGVDLKELVVCQPKFFQAIGKLLNNVPLEDWKIYLEWHLINDCASLLSKDFVLQNFNFYGKVLTGSKEIKPLWRRALGIVNGNLGEPLGKIYVKKHFGMSAKKAIDKLVDDLFISYEEHIKNVDWMSKATKRKALAKLKKMNRKIGYPKKFRSYKGLVIKSDDLFGNIMRIEKFQHKRQMRKLRQKVDRDEWFMSPQTVNAYCDFNLNDIAFPAAILQPPFFSEKADAAVNYGAIGSVIGHEITHGFDDQGSRFDGDGNMKKWWQKADRTRFERKARRLVEQFNKYEVLPGVKANGKLTLGENITDLNNLSISH